VGGHVYRPADDAGVCAQVVDLVKSRQARRLVWVPSPALQDLGVEEALKRAGCELRSADFAEWIGPDGDEDNARAALRQFFASADMAISGASYAIADTGTLVLTAGRANPRSATNLPPQHVAVIRPGQIVSTLVDLVPQLKVEAARASALTLITGPSRTSDIEQISTVGVHGPIELHVVIRP
jgi:L-lactate dehydrogenase complex protein LldG